MINPWEQKKIAGVLFGIVLAYLLAGMLYTCFGAQRIAARENQLTALSSLVQVPPGSVVVRQEMKKKLFRRVYSTQYICSEDPEYFLQSALRVLRQDGWEVEWLRTNALEAHKAGLIIEVSEIYGSHLKGNLAIDIRFDDIFDRFGI